MRVAIQHSFPNYYLVAETELIQRFVVALWNLGWEVASVVTSDDILRFRPDWVLATHYTSPKLTHFPTIGMMTNPPEYFRDKPEHMRNILSYDGYLVGSQMIRHYLKDIVASKRKKIPLSDFLFHLSTHETEFEERRPGPCHLFYIGTRWDQGQRHGSLFEALSCAVPLDVYGPPWNWEKVNCNYKGRVRADGRSVLARMRESGAALCIHSKEHRDWRLPTMRVFEAAAAGAVILCDDVPLIHEYFGDAILPVDTDQPVEKIVRQVASHMTWINEHPDQAAEMVRKAHAIFREKLCLERMFERTPAFIDQVRRTSGYMATAGGAAEQIARQTVEYVIPIAAGAVIKVEKRLRMLRDQSYRNIGIILAFASDEKYIDAVLERYRGDFVSMKAVTAPGAIRRNALRAGLGAVTAPFFAVLTEDHRLHPNHVACLMDKLEGSNSVQLVQASVIEASDEAGPYFDQWNFHGPLGECIPETRRLAPPITANNEYPSGLELATVCSWIARSELLDDELLEDPDLPGANLLSHLLEKAKPGYSGRPTCEVRVGPDRVSESVSQQGVQPPLPAYTSETPESMALHFLRQVPLAAVISYDPKVPESFAFRRLCQAYFAARGVAKVLARPLRLPQLAFKGLRALIAQGPRRFLARLAGAGQRL